MEERVLIRYLQDIVDLETQKRIAGNTYNRLSIEEKDNAYVLNASLQEKQHTSGVLKKIRWLPLIGKVYLGLFVAALMSILLAWTIIFALMLIRIDIPFKSAETFSMIVCFCAVAFWIIRKEVLSAKGEVQQERDYQKQYIENVKKGKIILAQIQKEKPKLKSVYHQCEESLEKLYALNIVHPQYQYLEACGMFLQYLGTGRTHSLEQRNGDAGAYNLYEKDLKFNVIKAQLDQVLKNQEILYNTLNTINNNVENLCSSVSRIERYAKQTEQNTRISAWCDRANSINIYALRRMHENYLYY